MSSEGQYEVVISGIGARLPDSSNIHEFGDKLFSKSVLYKDDLLRWIPGKCIYIISLKEKQVQNCIVSQNKLKYNL